MFGQGEKALQFDKITKVVKYLFECIEEGWMMKKEFNQIKKDFNIKLETKKQQRDS